MNIKTLLVGLLLCSNTTSFSQKRSLTITGLYGLNTNFFVGSYDETGGPANKTVFYKKKLIGRLGGLELQYNFRKGAALGLGWSESVNSGRKNFFGKINGVDVIITDFNLHHKDDFFQLFFEKDYQLKSATSAGFRIGLLYTQMHQSEIEILNFDNVVRIEERNTKNSGLEEAGVVVGIQSKFKLSSAFQAGLSLRAYYFISSSFLEGISLTPTISYSF